MEYNDGFRPSNGRCPAGPTYIRCGTTTLFAALQVAIGKVTDTCYPGHRHEDLLKFVRQVAVTLATYSVACLR